MDKLLETHKPQSSQKKGTDNRDNFMSMQQIQFINNLKNICKDIPGYSVALRTS